ncbi:MAG TPA: class I SAM-dependent methyltransferase [Gemmataceae bacterium]|nr:class I SAM-dependent methyltransferase [Reyranella sp.]HZV05803.1 class I SAM-dependent methyltransferase [Gemmataceae bacterium]
MEPESYRLLAGRQDTYWWHRARRSLSRALLRRHGLKPGARWLDLGCGPGANLAMLDDMSPSQVVGVDLSPLALDLARRAQPAAKLVRADVNAPQPFLDRSFDLVTIYNVLYHRWVESELAVLREVRRVLAPGGLLLLTEPAFPALARGLDVKVMTRRRYVEREFDDLFAQAGLRPLFGSYFTSFGYPLLLAVKKFGQPHAQQEGVDTRRLSPLTNSALLAAATIESVAIRCGLRMPFGTTLMKIARRLD